MEKLKVYRCERKFIGVMLMDLAKAFDSIHHNLIVAKLDVYDS